MIMCFLCVKPVRPSTFPGSWFLWLPKSKILVAETNEFFGHFTVCAKCADWAEKNELISSELIYARILALEKDKDDTEEDDFDD